MLSRPASFPETGEKGELFPNGRHSPGIGVTIELPILHSQSSGVGLGIHLCVR
jgi:hypothetical protein